ncbi:hypothetical protein BC739_003992 [Kutzneria viridogrisea]|uniref:Uncharacterized protein n=1 Tax=Kutzneria viridogrisea TaxID=47990 RepID=A0ABR6BIU0_9PSEU|nr:hypothetical protein [Kutzneria viridogrisea]
MSTPANPTGPKAEANASQRAHDTGTAVEVADQTTQTRQVMANPDGTFTLHSTLSPVRVKRGTGWIPIDTTLASTSDGRIAPSAAAVDVSFSGGGTGPLVTLRNGAKAVSLSWPTALPTPTIAKDTALYPAVLPGVDLQVTAHADSYSEVLIVHDATAAANPALKAIHLTATGTGLTLATKNGGLSAQDSTGTEVFHGPVPRMWDSTTTAQSPNPPSATDPSGGHVTPLTITGDTPAAAARTAPTAGMSTVSTALTITAPAAALTGTGVNYPLFLDPSMSGGTQHWLVVSSGPTSERIFDDPTWPMQVGNCASSGCNSIGTARSYFQVDTSPLMARNGKTAQIHSAYFYANEIHQAVGCVNEPVRLFEGGAIGSGTAWPGPLGDYVDTQSSQAGNGCGGANNVVFNAYSAAQWAAANSWTGTTLALVAGDESKGEQWKKFDHNARLDVVFNFPPNAPTGLHVSNTVTCTGTPITPDAHPTLYASATDNNNPPLNIGLAFEVYDNTGTTPIAGSGGSASAINIASGSEGAWTDTTDLGDGKYAMRVADLNYPADDSGSKYSGYSYWYNFDAHSRPITQTPTATSFDYPANYWGAAQGAPGMVTLHANGAANIVGFAYTFTGSGTEAVPNTGDCDYNKTFTTTGGWAATTTGDATVAIPSGLTPGYHTLHVRSFDDAHKLSPESPAYTFYISPNTGVAMTRLEAENTTQVTATQPTGQTVTLGKQDCASWCSGDAQLYFQGNAAGQSFTMTVTAPIEADYALGAQLTKSFSYGQYTYTLDKTTVLGHTDTAPFDGYNPTVISTYQPFGGVHLTKGTHTITATAVGHNSAATGTNTFEAGIDSLTLAPINNVTSTSMTDAMNNHGIAEDNTTPANADFIGQALSAQSLAEAGLAPGNTKTISGATFTMPAKNTATGSDNVIAASQTITLPSAQRGKATAVGFLAVSTCGTSPTVTTTLTYADGTYSNPLVPAVPDWLTGPADSAASVLSHADAGATPGTGRPKVYAIFLPADPSKTLASVTLPNIGTTFLPNTCTTALHVLAIAPRPVQAGWLGAWAAPTDMAVAATQANKTVRLIAHPTTTGDTTRIHLSNAGVTTPTTIDDTTIAGQSGTGPAALTVPVQLSFCTATGRALGCGVHAVTLPPGGEAYSDPVAFPATTNASNNNLVVSLHLPSAPGLMPVHYGATTIGYTADTDVTANSDGTPFTAGQNVDCYLTGIDVSTNDNSQGTVAILGDQTSAAGTVKYRV